jgi:hypothetical protein
MKYIKNFKVKEVHKGQYSEIQKITFENGYIATPEEDTGGEYAYMIIDGYELNPDDLVSFNCELDEYDCISDFEFIEINGFLYRAWVESEGGNDCTCLSFYKSNELDS